VLTLILTASVTVSECLFLNVSSCRGSDHEGQTLLPARNIMHCFTAEPPEQANTLC